jgi:hypothetical protein
VPTTAGATGFYKGYAALVSLTRLCLINQERPELAKFRTPKYQDVRRRLQHSTAWHSTMYISVTACDVHEQQLLILLVLLVLEVL